MSKCTTEVWTMQEISDALQNLKQREKKIVIPRFQRGQRWDPKAEDSFIDSVRNGYPVGTLLFYKTIEKENNLIKEVYTLVDGLQRSTAIYKYMQEPMKYFGENEVTETCINDIYAILGFPESQKKNIVPVITKAYVNFIHELKSYKNPQAYTLAKSILKQITVPDPDSVMDELIPCLSDHLEKTVSMHETIAKSTMPAVVYTGDENDLPEIFNRINSKGTPLNTYEIYAASWPQKDKVKIHNARIIDYILAKYDALHDDIYTIQGYDREELRTTKEVTLFEYVFGLSKWLSAEFPLISFDKHLKADEVTPIGFELLDACFFETKKIGEIYKELQKLNVNHLERAVTDCIRIADSIVSPITKFKGNRRKNEIKPIYAKNQILSIIAFIFRERYSLNDLHHIKSSWSENEPLIRKRVFSHFVYDIINSQWDQGSSKLHLWINSGKYHEDISASAWESALTNMYEKEVSCQERKNVAKASNADIAFMNCIYLTKFTALDQLSLERFDIEHIATKDLMKELIQKTAETGGLPISSVANLCYLPEYENRAKGKKTFYQDSNYLSRISLKDIEEKYSFTSKEDLEWVELPFDMGDFEDLKNEYLEFLQKRFSIQKRKFYEVMEVNPDVIGKSASTQNALLSTQTDSKEIKPSATYEPVVRALSLYFGREFHYLARTIVKDFTNEICAVMAYSKMYPQGRRKKYWFAVHPKKMEQCSISNGYYVFACSDDHIAVAFPLDKLYHILDGLNVSNADNIQRKYYHMVLFVDGGKVSCLLSHPEVKEIDVSQYCFDM